MLIMTMSIVKTHQKGGVMVAIVGTKVGEDDGGSNDLLKDIINQGGSFDQ